MKSVKKTLKLSQSYNESMEVNKTKEEFNFSDDCAYNYTATVLLTLPLCENPQLGGNAAVKYFI